ncbi:hypothetical protein J1N35_041424, partial [Gossypium stocksii]
VNEPTHLLAMEEETSTKEVNKFISFSFDDNSKTRVDRFSCDIEVEMLEVIIPQKPIWG